MLIQNIKILIFEYIHKDLIEIQKACADITNITLSNEDSNILYGLFFLSLELSKLDKLLLPHKSVPIK